GLRSGHLLGLEVGKAGGELVIARRLVVVELEEYVLDVAVAFGRVVDGGAAGESAFELVGVGVGLLVGGDVLVVGGLDVFLGDGHVLGHVVIDVGRQLR